MSAKKRRGLDLLPAHRTIHERLVLDALLYRNGTDIQRFNTKDDGLTLETIIAPATMTQDEAVACCGQPKGWDQGVILIHAFRSCRNKPIIISDIESVMAREEKYVSVLDPLGKYIFYPDG